MNADRGEVALCQESVEFIGARNLGDENDNLVEFENIQQIVELAVLLGLVELTVTQLN